MHELAAFETQLALVLNLPPELNTHDGLRSALYEASMVHLRSLCDFLCPGADPLPKDTDIIATDFDPSWAKALPAVLGDARHVANKQIVHLTYDRNSLPPEGQTIPWADVRRALREVFEAFEEGRKKQKLVPVEISLPSAPVVGPSANVASTMLDAPTFDPPAAPRPRR